MSGDQEDQLVSTSSTTGESVAKTETETTDVASVESGLVQPDLTKTEEPSTTSESKTDITDTKTETTESSEAAAVPAEAEVKPGEEEIPKKEETITTPPDNTTAPAPTVESEKVESSGLKEKTDADGEQELTEEMKAGLKAFYEGKRFLLIKDITSAVNKLGDACKLIGEAGGIFSMDSAESHFYYGKALMEQARSDLSVCPAPVPEGAKTSGDEDAEDDDEEMEEDEEEDEEKKEDEEMKEDTEESVENGKNSAEDKENLNGHKGQEEEDLNVPSPTAETDAAVVNDEEKPGTSSETPADPDATVTEDELTNLELAWEVLEVSKVGFLRMIEETTQKLSEVLNDKESDRKTEQENLTLKLKNYQSRLANVHSILGEVATESEQYPQAIEEINTALSILSTIEELDSREIAQNHFQLGIAYSFDKKFQEAIQSFKTSSDLIKKRISNLEKKVEEATSVKGEGEGKVEDDADIKAHLAEIDDLKAILPELEEKITDTLDAEKDANQVKAEEKKELEIIERNSPVKNPNAVAAKDISHLVKKKKKAEDLPDEEPPSKKACTEPDSSTQNGGHETVVGNGSTPKEVE